MTYEDFEKVMQFVADRQAKTEVLLQQLAESHAQAEKRDTERQARFDEQWRKSHEEFETWKRESREKFDAEMRESREKFDAQIREVFESHTQAEKRISELEQALVAGVNLVNNLHERMGELAKAQKELAEAQKKAEAEMVEFRAKIAESHARHNETNERLDIFIDVLERYITESRNGKPKGTRQTN
jgi:uncharacterized NAD-dependent epimerase/dehydratase family protein